MVICFVKSVLVYLYLCCSVVISYEAAREIPYYRDRTNQASKLTGQRLLNRYPNFNKVMTRIENLNDEVNTKSNHHKIRHRGWNKFTTSTTTTTEAGLFETYGDLEDEDYLENYEDNLEDEEDEFDYEDDEESAEESFDDTFEDIQAEEPTEAPVKVAQVPARPVSSMTEYKWQHYGTMERVQESRRQQLNLRPSKEQLKVQAALDHYARVQDQSRCEKPSPKVIPVQQEYPDPSKTYTPHCTVLHRCAEDTGCCKRNTKCQYKSRQIVHLYFYTQTIGSLETKVEKLAFYNHTECECQERNVHSSTESSDGHFKITYKAGNSVYSTTASFDDECECPKNFEPSRRTARKCACDCDEDNEDCIQLKKGKEHFSMTARLCLQESRCGLPICEYGDYSLLEGKCPTKKEKLEEYKKVKIGY